MSSGPGVLQKKILDHLTSVPSVFYNQLLWDLSFERNEIRGRSKLSPHIEKGIIRKSFKENFRRSVESLENGKILTIEKRILTNINEAFEYFPYHTERLEIHQLRLTLLPILREYIIEENPHKFGDSKIEEELISHLKEDPDYMKIKEAWNRIEKKIVTSLDAESPLYDTWVQILVRGRYLFLSASIHHKASFVRLYSSLYKSNNGVMNLESEILNHIKELIANVFDNNEWKLGKAKSVYYDMANMRQYAKDSLKDNVKEYLLNKSGDIIKSLPGHKEPEKVVISGISWFGSREPIYSDYLNHLITRQILRKQKILILNSMPS